MSWFIKKCEYKKEESKDTLDNVEAYKIALETRNFEIGLFWQRSNYFLLLNSALIIGYFRFLNDSDISDYSVIIALFGLFVSFLWFQVNLGSKYWQARWEERLKLTEQKLDNELRFFNTTRAITDQDVKNSIGESSHKKSLLHKHTEKLALNSKPSVSYNMTLLSIGFMLIWAILIFTSFSLLKDHAWSTFNDLILFGKELSTEIASFIKDFIYR
ncbi:RipA family octameric membrane protein [Vibrio sp. Vb339]|uniref:RipA family octameric membrane protein n=1 Tax=Vibrio sp. Vb339 TaxID=1192013 RepID=UPI001555A310|nr:hypothetical protein [Vibrio sp. Vb339]